jgi:hypothetical protein
MWPQIGIWVATSVLGYLFRPKPPGPPPPANLADIKVPTAEEGREIGVLFGTRDISTQNCVWHGDLKVTPIRKKGGKK